MDLPKTRKAAVKTAEGTFEIKEVPMPEITQPDYVLVKVRAQGYAEATSTHGKYLDLSLWVG